MLYIVPTPIGNLGDITLRALEVLRNVELILCEDTRHTIKLLSHFEIHSRLESFHAHNEHKKVNSIVDQLKAGKEIALVSDAGMPGISDPGYLLIAAAIENNLPLTCLPGPSAVISALIGSGLPGDSFFFGGFLPHKKGRQKRWSFLLSLPVTIVLFESPHRILKCLTELEMLDDQHRQIVVCRELTKKFESFHRGSASELKALFTATPGIAKGEIVVVIGPPAGKKSIEEEEEF